nr:4Fe-4S ferredoxin [Saprospiraceae bacterium]
MKENKTDIWVGTEDVNNPEKLKAESGQEFFDAPVLNDLARDEDRDGNAPAPSRRDFLKYLGFGLGAATIAAGCEAPVRRALPSLIQPDAIVPGVATYYSSNFVKGGDFCPVIIKTREGRPIKVEGNPMSSFASGGTSARAQASVLELYDTSRLRHPGKVNPDDETIEKMSWEEVDDEVKSKLNENSQVRILSNSIYSPSTLKVVEDFKNKYPNTEHIQYDAVSSSALIEAHGEAFGEKKLPTYRFDRASVVVSLGADFLGTWISPVQFARQWSEKRKIKDVDNAKMSRVIVAESHFSLTGASADNRVLIRPSEMGLAIATLHNELAKLVNAGSQLSVSGSFESPKAANGLKRAAANLAEASAAGESTLVVSGSNNLAEQMTVIRINQMLGNYGSTVDIGNPCHLRKGIDSEILKLVNDIKAGRVDALIVLDEANPVYDLPEGKELKDAMAKVDLRISTATLPNETLRACNYACPTHHYLESWGDVNPTEGYYGLIQPTIHPLFDTREKEESLLRWADALPENDRKGRAYYHYIRNNWEENIFPQQSRFAGFQRFWDFSLHNGFTEINNNQAENAGQGNEVNLSAYASGISRPSSAETELSFYETVHVGSGQYANNPWLQEMPDPLLRTVWDGCLSVSVKWDGGNRIDGYQNLKDGDKVELVIGDEKYVVPVVTQFGIMEGQLAFPLGYGREVAGPAGRGVGTNVFSSLWRNDDGNLQYYATRV